MITPKSHYCIKHSQKVIDLIGRGFRLVVPLDGSQPILVDGFPRSHGPQALLSSIVVPLSIAEAVAVRPDVFTMSADGEFDGEQKTRGGYKEFYEGTPAKVYCLIR